MVRRLARCPSCRHSGEFEYLGSQHWPPELAQKLKVPATTHLWNCAHCGTTLSDQELKPYRRKQRKPKFRVMIESSTHS
jgi:ribosomal protein L37AE/L43A